MQIFIDIYRLYATVCFIISSCPILFLCLFSFFSYQWEFQDPKMEVLYHFSGHILWGYSLTQALYMVLQVPPIQDPEMAIEYIYTHTLICLSIFIQGEPSQLKRVGVFFAFQPDGKIRQWNRLSPLFDIGFSSTTTVDGPAKSCTS